MALDFDLCCAFALSEYDSEIETEKLKFLAMCLGATFKDEPQTGEAGETQHW